MGKGIDLAKLTNPEHAELLENLRDQLLIVFLKRLGGTLEVPVAEVDDTGHDNLAFSLDVQARVFRFTIVRNP